MDLLHLSCIIFIILTFTGMSHGSGVLPNNLYGGEGQSVNFNPTVTPPDKPFVAVIWTVKFPDSSNSTTIISLTSEDFIGDGYKDRISFNRNTGSLEIRHLTVNDTGIYSLIIIPAGAATIEGVCTLEVLVPVSSVVVTANNTDLVEFNSSVCLSCTSSGSSLSYSWLNGSMPLTAASEGVLLGDGGSSLTIVSVRRYDQGPFSCRAENIISYADSGPMFLNVSYGPEQINLKKYPSNDYQAEGSKVNLTCSAVSSPYALFTWFLNGSLLSDTGPVLSLDNIQMNQSGTYLCQAYNTKTLRHQTSEPSPLTVLVPPSNVVVTPNNTDLVEFKSSACLSCTSSGSSLSYSWLNGSMPLTDSEGVLLGDGGSSLTIVSVSRYDQGPFSCRASNIISHADSGPMFLNISYGPEQTDLKVCPSNDYQAEGSKVILSCSAVSSPYAQFTWFLNGSLLSDTGPELSLDNIQMNQGGTYLCQAYNTKTLRHQTSEPSPLIVLENISKTHITASTEQPVEGSSLNLTCEAAGSDPQRMWMKDGRPLTSGSNSGLLDNNRVLSFSALVKTDSGKYLCNVTNYVSFQTAAFDMVVNYGPENVAITGPNQIEAQQTLTLKCTAQSKPDASYSWMLNGEEISHHTDVYSKTVDSTDSGNYICQAKNNVTGTTSLSKAHALSVTESSGSSSVGLIVGITLAVIFVIALAGVVYYLHRSGKLNRIFKKDSSNNNRTGSGHVSRAGPGNVELNYVDVKSFQKSPNPIAQVENNNAPDTIYSDVRGNSRPPPSYNAHMQKRPAPQPGDDIASMYAQICKQ